MRRMITTPPANDSLSAQIASQLRDAMIARGMKLKDLAAEMEITPAAACKMLDGSNLTVQSIERIARAIGIQCSFLILQDSLPDGQ